MADFHEITKDIVLKVLEQDKILSEGRSLSLEEKNTEYAEHIGEFYKNIYYSIKSVEK